MRVARTLNDWAWNIHEWSSNKGFWPKDGSVRNFGEMTALAHSELSEALEAHRESRSATPSPVWYRHSEDCIHFPLNDLHDIIPDRGGCTCVPKLEGWGTEYVDCIIRLLDTLGEAGVDIDDVLARKMRYNEGRPYKHGKAY